MTQAQIKRVTSPHVGEAPAGLWSNCLVVNGVAYLSGITARAEVENLPDKGDEFSQAKTIFTKMSHLLDAAGGSMADVVKLTIFVTDILHREKVWEARRLFFKGDFPACSLVQVAALSHPFVKVEIEGVAVLGAGQAPGA